MEARARWSLWVVALGLAALAPVAARAGAERESPDIVVVTVDTLRADRLSSYGYPRPTTPEVDRLLSRGVRFTRARVAEPLTSPALCSMWTALDPHEHGATRNGLRLHPGLPSAPKILREHGYAAAAFVASWTLRERLTGLAEHFDHYEEVLTRKRWFGLIRQEATAEDVSDAALTWVREHRRRRPHQPYLIWVHYVEPHAPYRFHEAFAPRLGLPMRGKIEPGDRYDTEVAFVDHAIGRLLRALGVRGDAGDPLVVFASDHGESLGEHDYWGHGRHLYETTLRIPMGLAWPGRIPPGALEAPATNLDLAPTLLGLVGLPVPESFGGYDWTPVLRGKSPPQLDRETAHQAHRGAVIAKHGSARARSAGLLAVARIVREMKEIYRLDNGQLRLYDLERDPLELHPLAALGSRPSEGLLRWLAEVEAGLALEERQQVPEIAPEDAERLRALGYVD